MRLGTSRTSWSWSNLALSPSLSHLSPSGSPQGVGKEGSEPVPRCWMEMRRGKGSEGEGGHPCPHRELDRNCPLWAAGTPHLPLQGRRGLGEENPIFGGEGNTPWTPSFAGIGGSCREKGQNSTQTPGWDRLGASNTFNALEFFPFPSSSQCLGLGGTGSVSSWRPGMSPRCHLAQRLGGHSGGTFWLGSCFILGEEGSIPYPGVGIPRLQPSLGFCPAFLGHLDPHDAHSCHHAPSSGRGLLGTG